MQTIVQNIITGGNNLLNIIRQILDVVKMYEGTLELHIENIPVSETLDEIIGVNKEKATKKNVLLENHTWKRFILTKKGADVFEKLKEAKLID